MTADTQPSATPLPDARPFDLEGIEVSIALNGNVERRTLTDEFGRFRFSSLPSGTYSLRILLDEHDTELSLTI